MLAKVFERQCTPAHGTGPIPAPADGCPNELFSMPVLAVSSVYRVLRRLPQHKATGGNISNRILREIAPCITSSVTNLFNASLTLGEFPSAWKLGTVIPIFKNKGNPCDPSNYRPITLLPAIAKALDKIVATKFGHYLEVDHIIVPEQFGFVRDRSTVDQLIQLTTKIASTMDNRIPYDAAFLDFAKAMIKCRMTCFSSNSGLSAMLRLRVGLRTTSIRVHSASASNTICLPHVPSSLEYPRVPTSGHCFSWYISTAYPVPRNATSTLMFTFSRMLLLLLFSLFEFAKTKRTELSSDKGANDERHNHYASKHLRTK